MCIIIDTNKLGLFLQEPPNKDMKPIHDWLSQRGGKLVYSNSGKFSKEIPRRARIRLDDYLKVGRAILIPRSEIEKKQNKLDMRLLKSDDPHIIALALAAKVDLLCTKDSDLMHDFTNFRIMGAGNRGRVYSSARNKNLLSKDRCP